MSGRGKSSSQKKAKGATGNRRARLAASSSRLSEISRPGVRRLCRRSGAYRTSSSLFNMVNKIARKFFEKSVTGAALRALHDNRKVINVMDVVFSLKKMGTTYCAI